jgi:hypothetical protein
VWSIAADVMSAMVKVKRVEVEACTKQSPHGCIANDGTVMVKTECRPGIIRLVIGSIRGSKFPKVFKGHVGSSGYFREGNSNKKVVITSQGQRRSGQSEQ